MNLEKYFISTEGIGVLSTADADGKVNAAIYSTPHFMEDGSATFIMRERLTHKNIQQNPYASYLFVEKDGGYKGIRLILRKIREDDNEELINRMTRRHLSPEEDKSKGPKHLVYFEVTKILPLIGSGENPIST